MSSMRDKLLSEIRTTVAEGKTEVKMYPFGLEQEIMQQKHKEFIQAAQKAHQIKQLKAGQPGLGARIMPIVADWMIVAGHHLKGQNEAEMADCAG